MGASVFVRIFKPDDSDYVLMVHNRAKQLPNGKLKEEGWGLPGGGVREGETEAQTGKRELKEETGVSAEISERPLKDPETGDEGQVIIFFEGKNPTGEIKPSDPDNQIIEAEWVYWKWLQIGGGYDTYKGLPVYHRHIRAIHHGVSTSYDKSNQESAAVT